MGKWLLTDREIEDAYWKYGTVKKTNEARAKQVAKAQAKKLVGWIEQYIKEIYPLDQTANEILQALSKEVGK